MLVVTFLARFIFGSVLLVYAGWRDLTKREVENWVPVALVVGGIILSVVDAFLTGDAMPVALALVSCGVGFGIALGIFYSGSMGGADCKIFIGITTLFPIVISSPLPVLSEINPLVEGTRRVLPMFSLSWLLNSLLISLGVPVVLGVRNTYDYLRGRITDVGLRTIPAFFVGYRTRVGKLRPSFVLPLERFEDIEGETVRVLRYTRGVLEESEERELIERVRENLDDEQLIWVFPYVPFILPMLAGYFLTLFAGDLLVNFLVNL